MKIKKKIIKITKLKQIIDTTTKFNVTDKMSFPNELINMRDYDSMIEYYIDKKLIGVIFYYHIYFAYGSKILISKILFDKLEYVDSMIKIFIKIMNKHIYLFMDIKNDEKKLIDNNILQILLNNSFQHDDNQHITIFYVYSK